MSVPAESRARRWLLPKGYSRHPGDVVRLVLGILILLLTTSAIHKDFVGSREAAVFRLFNTLALPDWTWPGVWLVMQFGVIGAVPLVAVVAVATRHLRLALDAVLAAGSIYLIAKVIKDFVQRGRPDTLLNDVHILGEPAGGLDTSPGTPQSRSRWPPWRARTRAGGPGAGQSPTLLAWLVRRCPRTAEWRWEKQLRHGSVTTADGVLDYLV